MQSLPDRESSITLMRNERTLNVQVKTLTDALKSYAKGGIGFSYPSLPNHSRHKFPNLLASGDYDEKDHRLQIYVKIMPCYLRSNRNVSRNDGKAQSRNYLLKIQWPLWKATPT